MAGRTEQARAQIIIDGQQAETMLKQLETRSKELKEQMRKLKSEGKDFSGVQKELRQTESAMNSFKRATFDVSKVMQNLSKATMKDLSRASNQLKADLKGMERGTQEYINKSRQLSVVRTELNKVQAEINGTAAAQQRANGSFGGGLKSMLAWTGGIYGVTSLMSSSVGEYMEAEKAQKKVAQAVKQTGMAAGFTTEELNAMAEEFQRTTTFEGDEIMNKVTAQLLSFPNLAGENFKLAQAAALDLATTLDGDLQAASIQLGKAMSDPVKGLTALRKSGVMFTEEQKEQVKVLVESGQLQQAQSLILQEVNKQYGGQAVAAAQGAGGILQLKNMWGDLKEDLGEFIVGEGNGVIEWLKTAITWLRNNGNIVLAVVKAVGALAVGWLTYVTTVKAVNSIHKIGAGLTQAFGTVMSWFGVTTKAATKALEAQEKAVKGSGMGALLGIVSALVSAYALFKDTIDEAVGIQRTMTRVQGEVNNKIAEETAELNVLKDRLLSSNITQEERSRLIGVVNEKYGQYLPKLLTEKSANNEIAASLMSVNDQLERKAINMMRDTMTNDIMMKKLQTQKKRIEAQQKYEEARDEAARLKREHATIGAWQSAYDQRVAWGNKVDDLIEEENKYQKELDETNAVIDKMIAENDKKVKKTPAQGPKEGDTMQQDDAWFVFKGGKWVPMVQPTITQEGTKTIKEQKDAYEELNAQIAEHEKLLRAQITTGDANQAQTAKELANLREQKQLIDDIFSATTDLSYRMEIKKPEENVNDFLKDGEIKPIATGLEDGLPQYTSLIDKWWQGLDGRVQDAFKNMEGYGKQFFTTLYSNKQDAWLASIKEETDADLANYKKLLDDKKITEDQYNAKVKAANQKYEDAQKEAERKKALFSIALNTAVAVAKSIAMAPPLGLPMSAIAMAEGGAQAAIVMAQKAEGQYPVQGADDGKTYNARYGGPVRRTHLATRPTVYLAGETRLPELIVSGPHLRNLQMNYPEVLRAIYNTRMTQHATGKYPEVTAAAPNDNTTVLLAVVEKLMVKLDQPWKGYVVKSDIDQIQGNEDFISERFAG